MGDWTGSCFIEMRMLGLWGGRWRGKEVGEARNKAQVIEAELLTRSLTRT